MLDVESQMDSAGYLVDILPAGTLGTNSGVLHFVVRETEFFINPYHSSSINDVHHS